MPLMALSKSWLKVIAVASEDSLKFNQRKKNSRKSGSSCRSFSCTEYSRTSVKR